MGVFKWFKRFKGVFKCLVLLETYRNKSGWITSSQGKNRISSLQKVINRSKCVIFRPMRLIVSCYSGYYIMLQYTHGFGTSSERIIICCPHCWLIALCCANEHFVWPGPTNHEGSQAVISCMACENRTCVWVHKIWLHFWTFYYSILTNVSVLLHLCTGNMTQLTDLR